MPILYIMVGAPGSGKTSWAHKFIKDNPNIQYVSRDEIRMSLLEETDDYFAKEKKVFGIFATKITAYLRENYDVIADATHITYASRKKLVDAILNRGLTSNDFSIKFIFINNTLDQCLRNNNIRKKRAFVPKSQIRRMWHQVEPPTINEFNNCIGVMTFNA